MQREDLMGETGTIHTYNLDECLTFSRPKAPWGAFSNFSLDFPLRITGVTLPTTEHLYQACRFPHLPDLQRRLLFDKARPSPNAAKMRAHKHEAETRPDWEDVRVPIMRWCLAVKLAQHRAAFGALLLESGRSPLVEVSGDDAFWGAVPDGAGSRFATGANMLGNLLMDLRATLSAPASGASSHGKGDDSDDSGDDDDQEWVPAPPGWLGLRLLGQVIVGERSGDHRNARQA